MPISVRGRMFGTDKQSTRQPDISDLGDPPLGIGFTIEGPCINDVIEDKSRTRLILKTSTFPPNKGTKGFNITGYLSHAKRSGRDAEEEWKDVNHFDLRRLRAGEYVRIQLGPTNLRSLFLALASKYSGLGSLHSILAEAEIDSIDPTHVTVLEGKERDTLELLMERDSNFWQNVEEFDTRNALETKGLQIQHQRRQEALTLFEQHLLALDWSEGDWENYFKENEWIFGLGLAYRYLNTLQNQAHMGGTGITGRGADKVDYLMETSGDSRFTVLVDIKKPDTGLLHPREYRSNIFRVGEHLSGGVAQLQSYCFTWQTEGSRDIRNSPEKLGAFTYQPKALLIVGRLAEFGNNDAMKQSFELFRRHIHNPEILTFDELYTRARFLVAQNELELGARDPTVEVDVPF